MIDIYIFDENGSASNYGVGKYIQNVIDVCLETSISVTVVLLETMEESSLYCSDKRVQYIHIPSLRGTSGERLNLDRKKEREKYVQYVVSILKSYVSPTNNPVFHLNYTQDYFLATSLKAKWPSSKIVLTVHYFTWCFALSGNVHRLTYIMSKNESDLSEFEKEVIYSGLFEQKLFKIVDFIICLSSFSRQLLIDYYDISEKKLWLIPNGIKETHRKANRQQLRKKYGIPEDEKMILFVGRLARNKGVDLLIEAFKKITLENICHSHLYLVGDGNFNDYLPLCYPIWRRVTFCGRILPENVSEFYQMSDIGVLPSLTEQCSFVAIEMLMNQLPIMATDCSGLDEMVVEGVNGFKVHLREQKDSINFSVEELATKLNHLLQSVSLEIYGEHSKMLYLQHYTFSKMQYKLYQLYTLFEE